MLRRSLTLAGALVLALQSAALALPIGLPEIGVNLDLGAFITGQLTGSTQTLVIGQVRATVEGRVKAADASTRIVTVTDAGMDLGLRAEQVRVAGRLVAIADLRPGVVAEVRGTLVELIIEGTVRAKQATALALETAAGTTRVTGSAEVLAKAKAGDRVRVSAASVGNGTVAAKAIMVTEGSATVAGTVAASSAGAVRVRTEQGETIVVLSSSTQVIVDGRAGAELSQGMIVRAFGRASGQAMRATLVVATRASTVVRGRITALDAAAGTFTLQAGTALRVNAGQATVVVGGQVSSLSALRVGDEVEVIGAAGAQFTARVVVKQ